MTLIDHIRLIFHRQHLATGDEITYLDGLPPPPTEEELAATYDEAFALWQSTGYKLLVKPEGFSLDIGDSARVAFSQMLGLVSEALDLGVITNETLQTIADKDGQIHAVTTLRFRQIMVGYRSY